MNFLKQFFCKHEHENIERWGYGPVLVYDGKAGQRKMKDIYRLKCQLCGKWGERAELHE